MKKPTLSGLATLAIFISSNSFAANYITCENYGSINGVGGFDTNCKIASNVVISPKTPVEQQIDVQYQFKCIGDEVELGLKDLSRGTSYRFTQSADWLTVPVTGYGPIQLVDFNPDGEWTASASFQPGCSLDAKVIAFDLATAEKKRLEDAVNAVSGQSKVVTDLGPLVSSVAVFKTILNQLDIPSIVSLLREKYNTTLALKEKFDGMSNLDSSNALSLVLDDLKVGICLNPAMAEKNRDICPEEAPVQPAPSEAEQKKDLVAKATDALTAIETAETTVKQSAAAAVSSPLVTASELLGYASDSTKKSTLDKLCPLLKTLGVNDKNCKN